MNIQEGKKIYVESLMSAKEYLTASKTFPSTYNSTQPTILFESEFYWRKGMGASLSPVEIKNINDNLDYLRTLVKEN